MGFRAGLRRALASPLGGPLARHFAIPAVTAIVADGRGGDAERVALAELTEAMVRVGVPRGRMILMLTGDGPPGPAEREASRALRDTLGVPVLRHDPAGATFSPGALPDGTVLELDDDLREAEAVVLCGRTGTGADGSAHGGPALLVPGLAGAGTRTALAAALGRATDPPARARAAWEAARATALLVPVDFALLWNDDDPPAVIAGEGGAAFAACEAAGWLPPLPGAGSPGA